MPSLDDQVKAKLAALKILYNAQLPGKVAELATVFARWQGGQQPQDLFECYRMAHSLGGSGAMYDAHDFSAKAKQLEFLWKTPANNKTALNSGEIDQSQAWLGELAQMARSIQESSHAAL